MDTIRIHAAKMADVANTHVELTCHDVSMHQGCMAHKKDGEAVTLWQ